jgi:hypothetical protein
VPNLGLIAIAEIVETEVAAHALRDMGCEFGQGFFFSKPVVAEVALQFLHDQPFAGLLQGAAGGGSAAVPTVKPTGSAEDESPTLIMPALTITEEALQEPPAPPAEPARRPKRTG